MSVIDRSLDRLTFLTDSARDALRRRLREVAGVSLIVLALLLAAALATWSAQDPSLSHATNAPIRNRLGISGAVVSDLLMQLLGLASLALVLPIAIWGWRLSSHRPLVRERMRIAAWIIGVALVAAFASSLPRNSNWPLPAGLGGGIGDALFCAPAYFTGGTLTGLARTTFATVTGLLAFAALAIASGFAWHARTDTARNKADNEPAAEDVESNERGLISLGWLVHAFLSLKTRLRRLMTRRSAGGISFRREGRPAGGEPPFENYQSALSDLEHEAGNKNASVHDEQPDEGQEEEEAPRSKRKAKVAVSRGRGGYVLPPLDLLSAPKSTGRTTLSDDVLQQNATALEGVLSDFGVRGEIINARPGPVVTLYELEPAPGIKSSRVIGLADDIARSMSAVSARGAGVAGRNAIGIQLPNPTREKVYLRELLASEDYNNSNAKLPLCLGKTIGGEAVIVDLARMPHLLIAGTTGSGKSGAINTMILSLLYRLSPNQCRLIMVDPKMLELSSYDGIPHLLAPVVTDPKKAVVALKWAVREMEDRYRKMSKLGVRNIDGYNARLADAKTKGEALTRTVHTGYDRETGEAIYEKGEFDLEPLPYLVVIVDEMADLMMVAGKDIEGAIQRLAPWPRRAGIHVILAPQRPSVDVITGTIKANFPTRISFQVTSKIDSRTILGEQGAEQLLGQGDMLYMAGGGRISRVHGPFCTDEEVEKVVRHLKSQGTPQYLEAVTAAEEEDEDGNPVFDGTGMGQPEGGDLYQQAVQGVMRDRKAPASPTTPASARSW